MREQTRLVAMACFSYGLCMAHTSAAHTSLCLSAFSTYGRVALPHSQYMTEVTCHAYTPEGKHGFYCWAESPTPTPVPSLHGSAMGLRSHLGSELFYS